MKTKALLGVTAVVELTAAAVLFAIPSRVAALLLGAGLDSPAAKVMARIAGAALLSIGLTCWLVRNSMGGASHRGRIAGLLAYNAAVAVLLIVAAVVEHLHGVAFWPAVALHAGLSIWCGACLATQPLDGMKTALRLLPRRSAASTRSD
jgi:hypothetical protein